MIPAENLIAGLHGSPTRLMAWSDSARDAQLKFEALELGVHGVVLETEDPAEV